MEECHKLGLMKAIGVSNFSCKMVEKLLSFSRIPPSLNQVEMIPLWATKRVERVLLQIKGFMSTAYSPLGGIDGKLSKNMVMKSETLKEIAMAHGKTIAQVFFEMGVLSKE
ncbi:putative aldo/keto reductase, aldo-keto reductase, NADP-dependent oxidoreductase [Dioscorea sansibarensis]